MLRRSVLCEKYCGINQVGRVASTGWQVFSATGFSRVGPDSENKPYQGLRVALMAGGPTSEKWGVIGRYANSHSSIICVRTFQSTYVPSLLVLRRTRQASACLSPTTVLVGLYWPLGLLLRIRYTSSLVQLVSPFFWKGYQPRKLRGEKK